MQPIRQLLCVTILICFVCSADSQERDYEQIAPLLDGMGNVHFDISTDNTLAQKFFDQGITFSYGFNHKEAYRPFCQAAELDPDCAMAYWRHSLVLGPNLNAAMDPDDNGEASSKAQQALNLSDDVRPVEKALIQTLTTRNTQQASKDRTSLDKLYAKSMAEVGGQFKKNMDVQVLYAEALKEVTIRDINTTQELMKIARRVLRGEIYAKEGQYKQAIGVLRTAVEIEDQLNYNEPPNWFFPVRHSLGAVLLETGKSAEAEFVFRRDLKKFPENG